MTLFGSSRAEIAKAFTDWEQVLCPLCNKPPERFATDCQGFHLCRCSQCRLEFLNPRPVREQLMSHLYNESYFDGSVAITKFTDDQIAQFSHQLQKIDRLLGASGSLLDVGCGEGAFLRFAGERGWKVCGTDVHLTAEARSLNNELFEGDLTEIDFHGRQFDAIRFNHVLEHTSNPLQELIRAKDLLKKGGIIFLSVPNLGGISPWLKGLQSRFHLKRRVWRHYAALHHLWFFRPDSLAQLCKKSGLQIVLWETPVFKKSRHENWEWQLSRFFLEKPHWGNIIDFYCSAIKMNPSVNRDI
jgi:2-polyprenyl-3-methyl-5-hydroxy-6-metoxy-1,4-benzoquinol methylase